MKGKKNRSNKSKNDIGLAAGSGMSARLVVAVDVERYQAWFDGLDLSPQQQEEFLQALWFIVVTFVELGLGVHTLQDVCGHNSASEVAEAKLAFDALKSEESDSIKPSMRSSS